MRHRVTIERQSTVQDDLGELIDTWTEVRTVWARVRPLSTTEFYAQSGEHSQISHEITVRAENLTVTAADRLQYDGRTFDIRGVYDMNERGRFIVMRCVEDG